MSGLSRYLFNLIYRDKIKYVCNKNARKYCLHSNNLQPHQTFKGEMDRFNGITVNTALQTCNRKSFPEKLDASIRHWKSDGKRCIWFKVNIKDSMYVPILADKGFNFHHARDDFVMMYKWLPVDSEPNLPPASHTNLGVGALVLNDKNQLLAVSEKHYEHPHWKLPGGYVEKGEDIIDAGIREVKEETGVVAKFSSLITFRHQHKMMYGNSDIYILLMMIALSEEISLSQREVKKCKWMNIEEYINHPHVHEYNKIVVQKAKFCKDNNIILNLKKKNVKYSQYTREMTYLSVDNEFI